MQYAVISKKEPASDWEGLVPDLPVCVAIGATQAEVEQLIREAVEFHFKRMREGRDAIPQPSSPVIEVEVAA